MNLKEMLEKTSLNKVKESYLKFYPDWDDTPIEKIYDTIKTITPSKQENILTINLEESEDIMGESYEIYGTTGEIENDRLIRYSMDFVDWDMWLNMEVNEDLFKKYDYDDIMALCLFEMTMFGFCPEDIKNQRDNIRNLIKNN